MRAAARDLRVLWSSRKDCGFPWPFESVWRRNEIGGWRNRLHVFVFGSWIYSPVSHWEQVRRIPTRPIRYARMVREIARVRNHAFAPMDYDDVP